MSHARAIYRSYINIHTKKTPQTKSDPKRILMYSQLA